MGGKQQGQLSVHTQQLQALEVRERDDERRYREAEGRPDRDARETRSQTRSERRERDPMPRELA